MCDESRGPRICMPTGRNFKKRAFHCGHYEAQDVLLATDDVDLICLEPALGHVFKEAWQRRLLYRDISRRLIYANPGLRKVRLTKGYDIFIAVCETYKDLLSVNAIEGWEDKCRTSICLIEEMWAASIPQYKYWLHALNRFDHIFLGCRGSVKALSDALGRPCHWLSGAVDAFRFSPYPNPPARVIDVYSIGRRWEGIHRSLLEAAQRKEIFYVYDTFSGSGAGVYNPQQHRDLFANTAKRSRYFVVAPGKMDAVDETNGQVEVGHRYYEGAAAGAVLIGQAPNCEAFREMFPWPDAVVEIQPDGSDVLDVLRHLDSHPERTASIGRRNASESLLRHDWVHRWKEMFRVAGIEPSPAMQDRELRLQDLAALVNSSEKDEAALIASC